MQKTDYFREYSNNKDHYFVQNNQTATTLIGNDNTDTKYQIKIFIYKEKLFLVFDDFRRM